MKKGNEVEALDERKSSRGKLWAAFAVDVLKTWGGISIQKSVGQNMFGRCSKGDAIGDRRQLAI